MRSRQRRPSGGGGKGRPVRRAPQAHRRGLRDGRRTIGGVNASPRPVLVVDFGAQYAQLIARRVREANVYSEIVPHTMSVADMLAKEPAAIILSGGPSSVYEEGAPSVDPAIFEAGVPVLGICYGFQTMAHALGGTVGRTGTREYGHTEASVSVDSCLFGGTPDDQIVWMSHGDAVQGAPEGFTVPIREVRLSAGAGFVVLISGSIMTMPGLPKRPSACDIEVVDGAIRGMH